MTKFCHRCSGEMHLGVGAVEVALVCDDCGLTSTIGEREPRCRVCATVLDTLAHDQPGGRTGSLRRDDLRCPTCGRGGAVLKNPSGTVRKCVGPTFEPARSGRGEA